MLASAPSVVRTGARKACSRGCRVRFECLFAAGFLRGLTQGKDLTSCARIGAIAAAEDLAREVGIGVVDGENVVARVADGRIGPADDDVIIACAAWCKRPLPRA